MKCSSFFVLCHWYQGHCRSICFKGTKSTGQHTYSLTGRGCNLYFCWRTVTYFGKQTQKVFCFILIQHFFLTYFIFTICELYSIKEIHREVTSQWWGDVKILHITSPSASTCYLCLFTHSEAVITVYLVAVLCHYVCNNILLWDLQGRYCRFYFLYVMGGSIGNIWFNFLLMK